MGTKRTDLKKRRGIYFTPPAISSLLVSWAVRTPGERVLEPSFGDCGFLSALRDGFAAIGAPEPWQQIFGCDVALSAFKNSLVPLLASGADDQHFLKADFLTLAPSNFSVSGFDVLIGNPPYVSHHNMFKIQRARASKVGYDEAFRLSGMASLWAYFVFHSLRFLLPKGRMAWLLPGSLLNADYSKPLLHELARRFQRIAVVSLQERLFLGDGASETTEILLCDGFGVEGSSAVEVVSARDLTECAELLKQWGKTTWSPAKLNGRSVLALTSDASLSSFRRVGAAIEARRLGDLARIAIGIVTGDNRLFVVNDAIARQHHLPMCGLRPILAKASIAQGLKLLKRDFSSAQKRGSRCLLVDARSGCEPVDRYFDAVPEHTRAENVTFSKRIDWRIPDDRQAPDAFLPYMQHNGPRLVLNNCGVNSTNTIHRVYFRPDVTTHQAKLAAISVLSSFSQISAEIEGRSYGAGVLKHEIREANSIQILLPRAVSPDSINRTLAIIDRLLRQGSFAGATAAADLLLASALPEILPCEVLESLRTLLQLLRSRRQQVKLDNDG